MTSTHLVLVLNLILFAARLLHAEVIVTKKDRLTEKGYEILAAPDKSRLPNFFAKYGEHGKNYYLDEHKRPYILCEHYDSEECPSGKSREDCSYLKKCYAETRSHELRCMAAFVFPSPIASSSSAEAKRRDLPAAASEITPLSHANASAIRKDCWSQSASELTDCNTEDMCIADRRSIGNRESTAMFCCCKTHKCNQNTSYKIVSLTAKEESPVDVSQLETWFERAETVVCVALVLFMFVCVCVACCFFFYVLRRKINNKKSFDAKQTLPYIGAEPNAKQADEFVVTIAGKKINLWNITMIEIVSNGRFGQVYKANADDLYLAVKIFPPSDVDSWICEQDLYSMEALRSHPNIASFVDAFPRDKSFWLLTCFCERGSLYDYLKENMISLHELGRISYTMLNGLAFLHEEFRTSTMSKPTIVHRDFKSKNILIKDDLTACITDFGLALKCETRRVAPDGTHGQVGTRRYMSPELLEGAMEFSSFAFQQTDVYAASLVLWELLSRTQLPDCPNEQLFEYMLPFEIEIGHPPSLGEIRDLVVVQKYRPQIRETLYQNEFTTAVVKTMIEMWDKEPDARITSGCARDRMFCITEAIIRYHGGGGSIATKDNGTTTREKHDTYDSASSNGSSAYEISSPEAPLLSPTTSAITTNDGGGAGGGKKASALKAANVVAAKRTDVAPLVSHASSSSSPSTTITSAATSTELSHASLLPAGVSATKLPATSSSGSYMTLPQQNQYAE